MQTQERVRARHGKIHEHGFSAVELATVVAIGLVLTAVALPGYSAMQRYFRIAGNVRDLNGVVAQAKMRAAADYTHARVHANLDNNTFALEYWDKTGLSATQGCWKTNGDSVDRCTASGSPVQELAPGVSFGTAATSPGGLNPQNPVQQAPSCNSGVAGGTTGSTLSGNTACIEFNSRGLPVNGYGLTNSNSPTPNDALYITDGDTVYGVTVIISGLIQVWAATTPGNNWQAR